METGQTTIDRSRIWVVVRAYNEERVIQTTLTGVRAFGYSVVVVDDGSGDATAEKARQAGAYVCRHTINLGAGAALQTGLEFALRQNPTVIVIFDADGQHNANDIEAVAAPILANNADVVLGTRFAQRELVENMPWLRALVLRGAVWITRLTTGLHVTDAHNGFKGFSPAIAARIRLLQNRMAYASELISQIAGLKCRVVEVPVHVRYTEYSLGKGQRNLNAINVLWEYLTGGIRR